MNESIKNLSCPFCKKTIGPKTIILMHCEFCGKDLCVKKCDKCNRWRPEIHDCKDKLKAFV